LGVEVERGEEQVVKLTRINGDSVTVNCDLILFVEAASETTITLANGERMKIRESIEDLCDKVMEFKRSVISGTFLGRIGKTES
jgi:flagellar protein FlbD